MKNTEETTKKMPIVSANEHGISIAIWENTNREGKAYKSISMSASTKQQDGLYKNRTIFFPSDLENLINAFIKVKEQADELGIKTAFEPRQSDGDNNEKN